MNKRGLLGLVVVVGVLIVVGFFWFVDSPNWDDPTGPDWNSGGDKGECVPASCCHAKSCVWENEAPDCSASFCTLSCEPETMDCGVGKCGVIEGECGVVWNE